MYCFYLLSTTFWMSLLIFVTRVDLKQPLIVFFFSFGYQVSLNSSVWQWDSSVSEVWTVAFTLE